METESKKMGPAFLQRLPCHAMLIHAYRISFTVHWTRWTSIALTKQIKSLDNCIFSIPLYSSSNTLCEVVDLLHSSSAKGRNLVDRVRIVELMLIVIDSFTHFNSTLKYKLKLK